MARLVSVNIGLPRDVTWRGKTVHTGVWKSPSPGPHMVRRLNIDGDGQGDLGGHGGENRAVLVYQAESYDYWAQQLGRADLSAGQFGENFTVEGLPDAQVCIGDRYRIGSALFEVSQPRVTCYRLGIRMNDPRMASLLVQHSRPGFYFRVIEEGIVEAGDAIELVAAGPEDMSVSEIDALLYLPGHRRDDLKRALRIPALSKGWRSSFETLLAEKGTGGAVSAARVPSLSPTWSGFRRFRVSQKLMEASNVVSLMLEAEDGLPLAPSLPGQFVVVRFGGAEGEQVTRTYSLSSAPGADHYRVSVKVVPGGAAGQYIDQKLKAGDLVEMTVPSGSFTLRSGNDPVVLLSGGIGVTPMVAMLHALSDEHADREIWWLHAARNGQEHAFAQEAGQLLDTLGHAHRLICYSSPNPGDRRGADFDASGHLDMAQLSKLHLPPGSDFYICGPPSFMDDFTAGLSHSGVDADRIHTELFGAMPAITPGVVGGETHRPHVPEFNPVSGARITFSRSGLEVHWDQRFSSLLELAEACDVPVRWSCRTGVCHTCETPVISGGIRYRQEPLEAPANGIALICCCEPDGDITVDL